LLEPSRATYIIVGRVVTPTDLTSSLTSPASAAGSHHTTTERDLASSASPEIIDHCVVVSTVDTMRAARRRGERRRDVGPLRAGRRAADLAPAGFGRHAIKRGVNMRASTSYRGHASSLAMKSSLLVVLAVLVASTCASYVGPYRQYYLPGFQHTYVAHIG